jgi:benzoate/toluate 1,2-dioxygenase alpha subunit
MNKPLLTNASQRVSDADLAALVQPERVHRRVYYDPDIFELEMERVFGRAWIFIGHESQIPKPGDYVTTHIARDPVVLCRHTDGTVKVLYNRCGHRGAKVVNEVCGNAARFRCLYHGWFFQTDGALAGVPKAEGFPADFDQKDPRFGMVPLARVESYRGFVFAKQTTDGPGLMDYLGGIRTVIDEVVNRSPEGEIEFAGGFHRYRYAGNWKFQAENLGDQYHAAFAHASSVTPDGYQFTRRTGEKGTRIKILNQDGSMGQEAKGHWSWPWGHGASGALTTDGEQSGAVFDRYKAMMIGRHGEERARDYLTQKHHSCFAYPSFNVHVLAQAIRVIRPISVNETEVLIYPIKLKGAPDEMFHDTIKILNTSHSASSLGQTDDVEAFERAQEALYTRGEEWLIFLRGMHQDVPDPARQGMRGPQFGENTMRLQHQAWLKYMTDWDGKWTEISE